MYLSSLSARIATSRHPILNTVALFAVLVLLSLPDLAYADDTRTKVCGFFTSIKGILNAASIVVVTVAVIFSGYQIAFAHKRISDVTPALIGGVMIGAAAQIAKTVVGNGDASNDQCEEGANGVGLMLDALQSALQLLSLPT
jgi:type IV secretion system protein VirB2